MREDRGVSHYLRCDARGDGRALDPTVQFRVVERSRAAVAGAALVRWPRLGGGATWCGRRPGAAGRGARRPARPDRPGPLLGAAAGGLHALRVGLAPARPPARSRAPRADRADDDRLRETRPDHGVGPAGAAGADHAARRRRPAGHRAGSGHRRPLLPVRRRAGAAQGAGRAGGGDRAGARGRHGGAGRGGGQRPRAGSGRSRCGPASATPTCRASTRPRSPSSPRRGWRASGCPRSRRSRTGRRRSSPTSPRCARPRSSAATYVPVDDAARAGRRDAGPPGAAVDRAAALELGRGGADHARGAAGGRVLISVVTVLHRSAKELATLRASLDRHLPEARLIAVDTARRTTAAPRSPTSWSSGATTRASARPTTRASSRSPSRSRSCSTRTRELLDDGLETLAALAPRARRAVRPAGSSAPAASRSAACIRCPGRCGRWCRRWRPRRAASSRGASPVPRTVGWAVAAALVARTDVLRGLGPFDPRIHLHYEDMDLCLRARARGVPTVFWPGVTVVHAGGHSTGRAARRPRAQPPRGGAAPPRARGRRGRRGRADPDVRHARRRGPRPGTRPGAAARPITVTRMLRRALLTVVACLVLAPSALAQSAGDDQYKDPFGGRQEATAGADDGAQHADRRAHGGPDRRPHRGSRRRGGAAGEGAEGGRRQQRKATRRHDDALQREPRPGPRPRRRPPRRPRPPSSPRPAARAAAARAGRRSASW